MVAHDHYQRLKHLYAADAAEPVAGSVEISYGHAELAGTVGEAAQSPVRTRRPLQQLLSDVSSLAAGSVEKDGVLAMDRFSLNVQRSNYQGPVQASAEVVFAEPPRYHVRAVLRDREGEPIAESMALFAPSGEELPPDPSPDATDESASPPPPAPFMPVHMTPVGLLCLN